ncbi:MAG: NAD-glutamate dehydrogenase domain-containing protein [Planctomycetota bacterium]
MNTKSVPQTENGTEARLPWMDRFRDDLIGTIDEQMRATAKLLPASYFATVSEDDQIAQLKALMAMRICEIRQEVMLRQRDGRKITVIAHENYAGFLAGLIERLPEVGDLVGAKIFSSKDGQFVIDIFEFETEAPADEERSLSPEEEETVEQVVSLTEIPTDRVRKFVAGYRPGSEILGLQEELAKQIRVLDQQRHPNELNVVWQHSPVPDGHIDKEETAKQYAKVVVSSGNATTRSVFARAAQFFARYQIDIVRAFCENIQLSADQNVALLTFHICIEQEAFDVARSRAGSRYSEVLDGDFLRSQLLNFLRVDGDVVRDRVSLGNNLDSHFGDLLQAELFCAFARMIQHHVSFVKGLEPTAEQVVARMLKNDALTRQLICNFLGRFGENGNTEGEFNLDAINDNLDRAILKSFHSLATGIDRCNLHLERRRCLAFRIPGELFSSDSGETPFAIFYIYGQDFDGFHVRFRDVARGGMRIVRTRNREHFLFESSRTFDEVYRLSSAQQLKNKDIAEGGAKAVIVLNPGLSPDRAGRDFVDGILDLLVLQSETTPADCECGSQEFLYLGPDENVTNQLINWIVDRARERGYPIPSAIMSSKPATGINHKEFGVTSEGVTVFLDRALVECGLEPRNKPFTVKLTGGPDGDVGGNEIRILVREYGENARIIAIADGTGSAYDSDGLNQTELLRLVEAEQGIANFDASLLRGAGAKVAGLDSEDDVARRNNMHFMYPSDVFIPAGGRPSAINENNWEMFLDESGTPKSGIVVEGANLFITEGAREHLSQAGTVIVKDSSANKCGVICSSLEILGGILLPEAEFIEIKEQYVEQVLAILRSLASIEAISLFNEKRRQPDRSLPKISILISRQIIRVADQIAESFDDWDEQEHAIADDFILDFLPDSLIEKAGPEVTRKIPANYRKQLVASILSSRIVYREGCQNIEKLESEDLQELIRKQLVYEHQVRQMINEVKASNIEDKDKLVSILDHAGARAQRELKL